MAAETREGKGSDPQAVVDLGHHLDAVIVVLAFGADPEADEFVVHRPAEEAEDADADNEPDKEAEEKPADEAEADKETDATDSGENVSIAEDRVKNALGEAMNAEKILALAVAGKKYNELCKDAADEAIKQGVRAMGTAFNEDRWRKVFSSGQFDLKDIQEQCAEWGGEAASALNAGKRMSVPASSEETNGKRKPTVAPKDRL